MRNGLLAVVMALVVAGHAGAVEIGDPLPSGTVKMRNVDGRDLSIADVTGPKGVLVLFSCNHCPWVQRWESRLVALGNEYSAKGIGVIAINSNDTTEFPDDSFEHMVARAEEKGYAFPYVVDATSDVARAFGATKTPEAYLFDASGKLVYTGTVDDNARDAAAVTATYLKDALDAVLDGAAVPNPKTKALGCSIKYR